MAKKVLEGNTRGYRNHSQLIRFRASGDPLTFINLYLSTVFHEAERRGYRFDRGKVDWELCGQCKFTMEVSRGQVEYEKKHLLEKLKVRDLSKFQLLVELFEFEVHPVFVIVDGGVEDWEKR